MQAEPLLEWSHVARELASFVATFLSVGSVGFRYAVAGRALAAGDAAPIYADALRRAAALGLAGALARAALLATGLPAQAARRHVGVAELVTGTPAVAIQVGLVVVMVVGLALAAARSRAGWPLAALGVLGSSLRPALTGEWARLVNPVHVLAGGLWIGTLLVLLAAGLPAVLRAEHARGRRDVLVADMVNAFSPLALAASGVLVLFGVITAWRHLPTLDALWTTPYGYDLLAKLAVVATVFALGAWNWKRMRPQLGTDRATSTLRRSATAELVAAGVVLVLSAVLVSLPSPRESGAPAGAPGGAPGSAPGSAPGVAPGVAPGAPGGGPPGGP